MTWKKTTPSCVSVKKFMCIYCILHLGSVFVDSVWRLSHWHVASGHDVFQPHQLHHWNMSVICEGKATKYLLSSSLQRIFPLPSRNLPTFSTSHPPKKRMYHLNLSFMGPLFTPLWCSYTLLSLPFLMFLEQAAIIMR